MFDTDKFIECVHEKVAIWDKSSKEYSDKIIHEKSWVEIGEIFYDDWIELDSSEKNEKVKEMKNKWRHIRDNLMKFLSRGKSGDPAPKMKKYIYAESLQFLLTTIEKRTSGNIDGTSEDDNNEEKEEYPNDDDEEERGQPASGSKAQTSKTSQYTTSQRQRITPFQQELLKKFNKHADDEEDADKSFLLSLVPDYKKLNDNEKLDFRLMTLQFFKNCQQFKNVRHGPTHSSSQAYYHPQTAVNYVQQYENYPVNPLFNFPPPPTPVPSPSMMQRPSPMQTPSPSPSMMQRPSPAQTPSPSPSMMHRASSVQTPSPSSTQTLSVTDTSQCSLQMYTNEY